MIVRRAVGVLIAAIFIGAKCQKPTRIGIFRQIRINSAQWISGRRILSKSWRTIEGIEIRTWTLLYFGDCTEPKTIEAQCEDTSTKVHFPVQHCGESLSNDERIINGIGANLGEYPWMAAIGYTHPDDVLGRSIKWFCGGSLVTYQHVLTAAHCLNPSIILPYQVSTVRVSELDLKDSNDGAPHEDVGIQRIVWHPSHDDSLKVNDIGIIKLNKKLEYNALHLVPICLPAAEIHLKDFTMKKTVVAGWGRTGDKVGKTWVYASRLQLTEVTIQNLDNCRANLTSAPKLSKVLIDNRVVCASSPESDTCKGDSGSPLMLFYRVTGHRAKMYIYGIVSYGQHHCAERELPSVYTKVSMFMAWIEEQIKLL